jgi:hypothetical protein
MVAFGAAAAANPRNEQMTEALLFIGLFGADASDGVAITMSTVVIKNQDEIGAAGGISGDIRAAGSALGSVVYNTILANRLSQNIAAMVPEAVIGAGLPASSIGPLLTVLRGLAKLETVDGLNS